MKLYFNNKDVHSERGKSVHQQEETSFFFLNEDRLELKRLQKEMSNKITEEKKNTEKSSQVSLEDTVLGKCGTQRK